MENLMGSDVMSNDGGFCNDALWDTNYLINSSWPRFTDCFQQTVLVYTPCLFLWLPLPLYVYSLSRTRQGPLPVSRLTVAKLLSTVILIVLSFVLIIETVTSNWSHTQEVTSAQFVALAIRIASYVTLLGLTVYERYRHATTSGVAFMFWFTFMLCDVIPLYTRLISEAYNGFPLQKYLFLAIYIMEVIVLLLNVPADNAGCGEYRPRTSPEVGSSYISSLLFMWIAKTLYLGWRKELKEEDLFNLNPRDASDTVLPPFEKKWKEEVLRSRLKNQQSMRHSRNKAKQTSYTTFTKQTDEKEKLVAGINKSDYGGFLGKTSAKTSGIGDKQTLPGDIGKEKPSLLKVILKIHGGNLLIGLIQKILSDVFLFLGPVLLSLLISYADDKDRYTWQGYALTILLFASLLFKTVLFDRSFWTGEILGMQVMTTLVTAIFKKALTMNNRARQKYTAGDIVNLMSVDCVRIRDVMNFFYFAWATPLQTIAVIIILYQYIGWSVFAGLATLLLMVPINSFLAGKQQTLQIEAMRLKDQRIRLINESLSGMKVIKLYAWEPAFRDQISAIRKQETDVLLKIAYLNASGSIFFTTTPLLVTFMTFGVFVWSSDDNVLDANKAFVSLSYFGLLRVPLILLSEIISMTVQAVVSIKRINTYLCTEDLDPNNIMRDPGSDYAVTMEGGTFTWDSLTKPTLNRISLKIPDGSLTAVVGTVGSGKSSLMSALLGEMEKLSGLVTIKGSVAYVQQQAWIQNATIRDNILFGKPFDKKKYQRILSACALERDLQILSAGDMTEIGEKGINLSGGQKQRVSLARAVYSEADIYIMDDPLSAVDSHVGKHIFNNVISKQGILKGKTCILVTHGIHWLPMVDNVIVMEDGRISESGSYESLMAHNGPFARFIQTFLLKMDEEEADSDVDDSMTSKIVSDVENLFTELSTSGDELKKLSSFRRRKRTRSRQSTSMTASHADEGQQIEAGRLIQDEKIESGKVKNSVYWTYMRAAGVYSILASFAVYILFQVVFAWSSFIISDWTQDSTLANLSLLGSQELRDKQNYYIAIYGVLGIFQIIFLILNAVIYWTRMVVAAKRLHMAILKAVFRCPMSFFDTSPRGRILNRFSRDIEVVDSLLPMIIRDYTVTLFTFIATLVVVTINTPIFLSIVIPVLIFFLFIQSIYVPTSRQIRRLESVTRSPIYSHFSETLSGTSTIRAFEKTSRFIDESKEKVDRNVSFYYINLAVNRSVAFYMDCLSSLVIFGSALFSVLSPDINGAVLGLSVSYAFQSASSVVWMVRQRSELESDIVSVERLKEYTELQAEEDWIVQDKRPPLDWPAEGKLEFKGYKTRYRPDLELVLKGISCNVEPGEKIGIVGRTGAGKSSLALALFRLIEASEGSISVDGMQISDMGLHDVRSRFTILPQDPVLFFGSLRMNLDPIDQYTDDQLWDALTTAHLKDFVRSLPQGLDYQVGEEGQSLSVGQRQLVCLARALLKKTKILILDEATAAVDVETDKLIQDTIRVEFQHSTVISIAHRLNTIMDYDRIMVLDAGLIKEMDTPSKLLANQNSAFYDMAKDANLA